MCHVIAPDQQERHLNSADTNRQSLGLPRDMSGPRSHQRISGAGPEYSFAIICAGEVDLAKRHGFSCA